MSSDGDQVVFQAATANNADPVLFQDKNYTFITDSTSNSGSFSSGSITFDLSTLNSQSQWVSLPEATIEFPVKITAQLSTAAVGTPGNSSATILAAINKCGFHQWIDSAQLIVNGQTVQASQPYENVAAQFRILSTWSQDTLRKWGPTCGVALDDMTGDISAPAAAIDSVGLHNANAATVATSAKGFDCVTNQTILGNKGVLARAKYNYTGAATTLAGSIIGTAGMVNAGIANGASASASNTAGTYLSSLYVMATVRVKDLIDISQFPLVKNLKGFLYLSFNSATVALTGTTGGGFSSVAITPMTGRTCPFMINTGAITFGAGSTSGPVISFVGTVDATTTGQVSGSAPLLTNARLICPYYIANPKVDEALTRTQQFSTLEKIVNPITAAANQTVNYTISVGVPNPRRLILLPMWQNLGQASFLSNPEISPFDSVPATSGPYSYLNNLQVYVANKPMYQYPISYDFEQWVSEQSQLGANGSMTNEMTSGLLSQQLWQQNHRFYVVDLSRRLDSEYGSSKSVQVSFTNPSSTYGLKVIAIVQYEKKWVIQTAQCMLQSA